MDKYAFWIFGAFMFVCFLFYMGQVHESVTPKNPAPKRKIEVHTVDSIDYICPHCGYEIKLASDKR